jgi:hypothetical protein
MYANARASTIDEYISRVDWKGTGSAEYSRLVI